MLDQNTKRSVLQRITNARARLLREYPLFGSMMMRLKFGLAKCGTAFTDMKRIVFDPEFVSRLSDQEIEFVLNHELLHCVLEHCVRGKGYNRQIYNIACDIVVNSNIMAMMGVDSFVVDGEAAMHLAPDGREGCEYSAEEVYRMLLLLHENDMQTGNTPVVGNSMLDKNTLDRHIWDGVDAYSAVTDGWRKAVRDSIMNKNSGSADLPPALRTCVEEYKNKKNVAWKIVLRDFVSRCETDYDYNFRPPDRRINDADIIFPGFNPVDGTRIENLWFLIDLSGSVSNREMTVAFEEVKNAVKQVNGLSGMLSFFDTKVTKPQRFDSIRSLNRIKPTGGGGTNFHAIFKYLNEDINMKEHPPAAIVIFTDGYADFPSEKDTLGIPVLWIIVNSSIKAPWGKCIHIKDCREETY